ncbi:MAG TPA: hypothetical protein VMZ53_25180 [Kofleriaceae bacterium]|nr:hypothetical protein [Kofleriaceae bacterium]
MRVVLLTLLVGCGFEHGAWGPASTVDAGDDVDAAIDAEAMVIVDAPPDPPPSTKSWVVIETLTVPVNGQSVTSQTALANGVTYHLRASGTWVIQSTPGTQADAEFWDFTNTAGPQEGVTGVDCGLAVDDTTVDTNKTPKWGAYSASHTYEIDWVGDGTTIVALMHDGNYSNNTGSLSLAILAYQ